MDSSATMAAQNKAALDYYIQTPVTREMVSYLAQKASEVIRCDQSTGDLPTPPTTPPPGQAAQDPNLPPVEAFITSIVQQSHVQVPTLMPALIYLSRLRSRLPPVAQGIPSTVHRIFLAALILAAKNLNDSSPKNKHWARYTNVPGYPNFAFSNSEVNLMEKQLLYLLDWDLRITNEDLYTHLEPFLAPIRAKQQRHAERKLQALLLERQAQETELLRRQQQQQHIRQASLQASMSTINLQRSVYDSPAVVPSTESPYTYTYARSRSGSLQPSTYSYSRSSSRAPSRTPSLSPPTRCDSSASYTSSVGTPASSYNPTPASTYPTYPTKPAETKAPAAGYYDDFNAGTGTYAYGYDVPEVVHIQPVHYNVQKALPVVPVVPVIAAQTQGVERPVAKRVRSGLGGFVSRYLGGGQGQAAAC